VRVRIIASLLVIVVEREKKDKNDKDKNDRDKAPVT
jgi:hypothetical protein